MKPTHLESRLMDMRVGMGAGAQWKQGSSQEYLSLREKRKTTDEKKLMVEGRVSGRDLSGRLGTAWACM